MGNILQVEHLYKKIGRFSLEDVNFSLEPGYIMGLIGRNGAGKTTLINTILGLYQPTSGCVKICGHDMNMDESKAKGEISFVLDQNPFMLEVSAIDNVNVFAPYYKKFDRNIFLKYCSQFDIDPKKRLKRLSKGSIIKFQIAFALSHDARLLVMDEPVSGLDPVFRKELTEIMYDMMMKGNQSIIFSTHLTEELDRIADFITLIDEGKQIFSKEKEELFDQYRVIKGSREQLNSLEDILVGKRSSSYYEEALVKNCDRLMGKGLKVAVPTMEDLISYLTDKKEEEIEYVE